MATTSDPKAMSLLNGDSTSEGWNRQGELHRVVVVKDRFSGPLLSGIASFGHLNFFRRTKTRSPRVRSALFRKNTLFGFTCVPPLTVLHFRSRPWQGLFHHVAWIVGMIVTTAVTSILTLVNVCMLVVRTLVSIFPRSWLSSTCLPTYLSVSHLNIGPSFIASSFIASEY